MISQKFRQFKTILVRQLSGNSAILLLSSAMVVFKDIQCKGSFGQEPKISAR